MCRTSTATYAVAYLSKNFGAWPMQNTVKATVDSLPLPKFQTFETRVPPTKTEETAIAEVLTEMDAELTALEQRRDKTRVLKQAMRQELLTGRTRLL
jgi:type I restriction enzyme, S subunit